MKKIITPTYFAWERKALLNYQSELRNFVKHFREEMEKVSPVSTFEILLKNIQYRIRDRKMFIAKDCISLKELVDAFTKWLKM